MVRDEWEAGFERTGIWYSRRNPRVVWLLLRPLSIPALVRNTCWLFISPFIRAILLNTIDSIVRIGTHGQQCWEWIYVRRVGLISGDPCITYAELRTTPMIARRHHYRLFGLGT